MALDEARERAEREGLDLVEVAPHVEPPVVKLMDRSGRVPGRAGDGGETRPPIPAKQVRLRPGPDEVDVAFKLRHGRRFLEEGHRVEFVVPLPERDADGEAESRNVGVRIAKELEDVGSVDAGPRIEGRAVHLVLTPRMSR